MSKKILKGISILMVLYPVAASVWQVLPEDITALIPNYTELIALVTGSASGLVGLAGLSVTGYIDKSSNTSTEIFSGLFNSYTELAEKVDKSEIATNDNTKIIKNLVQDFTTIKANQEKLIKLEQANLELKLSNPLIDEATKETYNNLLEG